VFQFYDNFLAQDLKQPSTLSVLDISATMSGLAATVFKVFQILVLRGGSWNLTQDYARSAFRVGNGPVIRGSSIGFRVVCSSPIFGH
jgi:formylglycine-generating enzyme required for sulfatase activity